MKTAIIVGASSGIGRELSKILSAKGFQLGLAARRIDLLVDLEKKLPNPSRAVHMDVAEVTATRQSMQGLIADLGTVDLVVISAGTGHLNPELDFSKEAETIATNVAGFTAVANVAFKHFLHKQSGHLVGISSIAALRGDGEAPAYNASKAFMSNYLEGLRKKAVKSGFPIAVTDIRPGFVDTDMAKGEGKFWVAPPQKAARQIYSAIAKKKKHAYITKRWRIVAGLLKIMPAFLYNRL